LELILLIDSGNDEQLIKVKVKMENLKSCFILMNRFQACLMAR
jgi:hypothetical protein